MQEYEGHADRWAFLAPWTNRLRDHKVRIKVKYASEHTYRRTFHAIDLTLEDGFDDEHDAHALAEAVELVATALAACSVAWHTVFVDLCECTDFANPHNEPLVARVEFDCAVFLADHLLTPLGQHFFFALMDERSPRSEAFKASRYHLGLIAKEALTTAPPVAITLRVAPNLDVVHTDQCLAFMRALTPYSIGGQTKSPWCVLETVDFDGVVPVLASELMEHTLQCEDEEMPLAKVSRVMIRPRDVSDFHQSFAALVHTYPGIEIEVIGDRDSFDGDESETSLSAEKTALVMKTIATADVPLKCLRIGPHQDPETRRVVWDQLFGTLLHPHAVSRIESLDLNDHGLLENETDANLIQNASARWGTAHHTPSILTLANTNLASLHAIITAFQKNLRHLSIVESPTPVAPDTVVFIISTCPKLEYLDLNNVVLDSMDVFYSHQQRNSKLSTLALTNLTLHDPASITRFFTQLADPQSSVGRHLGEFRLARVGDPAIVWDRFVLDTTHLPLLDRALRVNGRLHTVDVEVQDETPDWVMTEFMHTHRELAAVRRAPLAFACKLAWLSATAHAALNHDTLTHVFEFAAECMPRWVHVGKSLMEIYV